MSTEVEGERKVVIPTGFLPSVQSQRHSSACSPLSEILPFCSIWFCSVRFYSNNPLSALLWFCILIFVLLFSSCGVIHATSRYRRQCRFWILEDPAFWHFLQKNRCVLRLVPAQEAQEMHWTCVGWPDFRKDLTELTLKAMNTPLQGGENKEWKNRSWLRTAKRHPSIALGMKAKQLELCWKLGVTSLQMVMSWKEVFF